MKWIIVAEMYSVLYLCNFADRLKMGHNKMDVLYRFPRIDLDRICPGRENTSDRGVAH